MDQVKFVDDNLSIFSPNTGKNGPERLLIWTLLTQFGHQQIDEAISVKFISANTFFARIKNYIANICNFRSVLLFNQLQK